MPAKGVKNMPRLAVVGGGVIGLAVARRAGLTRAEATGALEAAWGRD